MIKIPKSAGLLAFAVILVGCSSDAPTGGSAAQIEANFQKEDPQKQIAVIQGSPASPERKAQLIKEIEDKYHIKANAGGPVGGGTQSRPAVGSTGK